MTLHTRPAATWRKHGRHCGTGWRADLSAAVLVDFIILDDCFINVPDAAPAEQPAGEGIARLLYGHALATMQSPGISRARAAGVKRTPD